MSDLLEQIARLEVALSKLLDHCAELETNLAAYRRSPEAILAEYGICYDFEVSAYETVTEVHDVIRIHLLRILELTEGNLTKASQLLGVNSKTVYNWLRKYNIPRPPLAVRPKKDPPAIVSPAPPEPVPNNGHQAVLVRLL